MISRSISLRSLLELAANGMQHGSRSPSLEKIQCLEMLAAHETAWRALRWTGSTPVDTLIGWGEPVSVSGNVLCFRTNPGMPRKNCFCAVPHPNCAMWWERLGGFNFRPIHRMSVSTLPRICSFVGDVLRGICILPSPSSLPLHCRFKSFLLSLERSHPLAQYVGVINATSTWRYCIGSMRVCGDDFAVACEQGMHISVWNWKSAHIRSCTFCYPNEMVPR